MVVQKAEQQVYIEAAQQKYAELQAEGSRISSNIDSIQDTMQKMKDAGTLDNVITASGWTYPVPGAYISAGTWAYPGGALHLGTDFAAAVGTPVLAVGNGIVMNSANGCPTYGGLGSTCGSNIGGARQYQWLSLCYQLQPYDVWLSTSYWNGYYKWHADCSCRLKRELYRTALSY